jgi:hypothetical protein
MTQLTSTVEVCAAGGQPGRARSTIGHTVFMPRLLPVSTGRVASSPPRGTNPGCATASDRPGTVTER